MAQPDSTQAFTVFVIPHTHWDREWYATLQQFRVRLVHVIDDLLEILARDPAYTHFNLDSQTVVLQDYLDIRPEQRAALGQFIRARRLGVGPWYVLPDEFLVSGEALVRNFQLGHRLAGEFGHVQKVGYIPDTFGHISQLPQILQGFDIGSAVHFRGLDEGDLKSEVWWQSPDGSRVLLRHLPTDMGYINASELALDIPAAAGDMQSIARHETRRAASTVLLALSGMDHSPARGDLPKILVAANQLGAGQYVFRQGSLEEYFDALTTALAGQPLQTIYGELRDVNRTAGQGNRVLPHVLSSRIYLKQQNDRAQALLERWAEPWSALLWLRGQAYPQAFLWKAWEWLLQNHAHDSIGGCSVDPVHAQMETRFAWSSEIAEEMLGERFELLAREIDLSGLAEDEAALVVFNGLAWDVAGALTVDIDLWQGFLDQVAVSRWKPLAPESELTSEMPATLIRSRRARREWWDDRPNMPDGTFRGLRLRPLDQPEPLPVQIDAVTRATVIRPLYTGPSSERAGTRVRASFVATIPAYGYAVFAVAPQSQPNKFAAPQHSPNVMENESLRVEIAANGTFTVADKTSGQVFRDLGYFEDGGDCGDGYNYSFPPEDRVEYSHGLAAHISRLSDGPVKQVYRIDYDWQLPESLDSTRRRRTLGRVACAASVTLSLGQGRQCLDLDVTFDNHARDHRLRMLFPSDINTDQSFAGAQFDGVAHPIQLRPVPAGAWQEDPPETVPQHDWVDLSDGARGLCLISQGLPEYAALDTPRREIALTLLRAVGYLGAAGDLQTAGGGAGPNIATPGAQIQRQLSYSLALLPHTGRWDEAEVWRQALTRNTPPRAMTTGLSKNVPAGARGPLPARSSFLSVTGPNAVLSAVKKADTGEALIVRLYNPSQTETQAVVRLPFAPKSVQLAGLDEAPRDLAAGDAAPELMADGQIRVTLPAGKIVTLSVARG